MAISESYKNYTQRVYEQARKCGLPDLQARIITGQAALESSNFKSNLFLKTNNLFGMKMPSKRSKRYIKGASSIVRTSEGSLPYADYQSLEDSVKDLILSYHAYIKTDWSKIKSAEDYATYLKSKGYYGGNLSDYISIIKSKLKSFAWLKKPAEIGGAVVIILLAILFIYKN